MAKYTWIYAGSVAFIAFIVVAFSVQPLYPSASDWQVFTVLTTLSLMLQVVSGATSAHHLRMPQMIFIFTGVLLLPPLPLLALILIPVLIDWERNKREGNFLVQDAYQLPLRIGIHTISSFCAKWVLWLGNLDSVSAVGLKPIMTILAAAAAYAAAHHLISCGHRTLIGLTIEADHANMDDFFTKLAMLFVGYGVAVLWLTSPWLILFSLIPGLVYYQVYIIPRLKKEAYTDPKTGLSNMRHFDELFDAELSRAACFKRSLAVIMVDVDDLGIINNTYGHLAGDGALMSVSQQIRRRIRPNDIAARLGGEEFCIVMTEVEEGEAIAWADELRRQIAKATFRTAGTSYLLQTTVSIGVAIYPSEGTTTLELIHSADIAMYQAKIAGKNRVIAASQIGQRPESETVRESTEVMNYRAAFGPRRASSGSRAEQPRSVAETERDVELEPHPNGCGSHASHLKPAAEAQSEMSSRRVLAEPSDWVPTTAVQVNSFLVPHPVDSAVEKYQSQVWHGDDALQAHSAATTQGQPRANEKIHQKANTPRAFVFTVFALGVLATIVGIAWLPASFDLPTLALFGMVALFVQLLQLSMYESSTISVSAAVILAGTILAGSFGLLVTSSVVVLVHSIQYRPQLYKIAFNWAVHILAGVAPLVVYALNNVYSPDRIQSQVALVLLAAVVYYVIESFLIASAIALANQEGIVATWEKQFRWLAIHYIVSGFVGLSMALAYRSLGVWGVVAFIMPVLFMYFSQKQYIHRAKQNTKELNRMNQELSAANKDIMAANQTMQQQNDELFLLLSKIIDARDPDVHGHASQVAHYATTIAQELGVLPDDIELVHQGALLHDIGKLGIAESILHKPGPLNEEEYEIIKEHPTIGADLLETCQILRALTPYVRHHHERWDGHGYPAGLSMDDIPLGARIVAVCDAVEAMVSDRPYRQGLSVDAIVEELECGRGKQFDPAVIDAFIQILSREGTRLLKNTARQATKLPQSA